MANGIFSVRKPENEPILTYAPGSTEREALKKQIKEFSEQKIEIPVIIGGKEIRTGNTAESVMPHDHSHVLATYHKAGQSEVNLAVEVALEAKKEWQSMPWEHRASVMLKAAELLAGPYRNILNAATMLCQSKNAFQAEIDSACELIDFFRFNAFFMQELYTEQPESVPAYWDRLEYRPLEGFIFAVTPFNFTSIAANLPSAPALMGNVCLWKPASSAVFTGYYLMRLFQDAGFPPGVINFLPGSGAEMGDYVLEHPDLAGIHFTGSTSVFQKMWKTVGTNIASYKGYPRIVGETGGKDFIFAHSSADQDELVTALVRGAYEFQGQKCSAASRAFIPDSMWEGVKKKLTEQVSTIRMGDPADFRNFMCAVIDKSAFDRIKGYIDEASSSPDTEIIIGGGCDDSKGYFIEPTVILARNPKCKPMVEEIFGPVLTIYVYPENNLEETLALCDESSPYALTGAIFGKDRKELVRMERALFQSAGNFYINDKPTGAVVGQQPFGGARASGTNDKAGSKLNLIRWTSPRSIKETFCPPKAYGYPSMQEE